LSCQHKISVLLVALLVLVILAAKDPVRAGGFTITAIGAKRAGSLATIARPDDVTALFHNPAALADMEGIQVGLYNALYLLKTSYQLKTLDERFYTEINPEGCDQEGNCPWPVNREGYYLDSVKPERAMGTIPYLGMSVQLTDGLTGSLAVFLPAFYGATFPTDAPTKYHIIDGYFATGSVTAGAGWRICSILAVGASVSYNYMRLSSRRSLSLARILTPADEPEPYLGALIAQGTLGDLTIDYLGEDHGMGLGAAVLVTPAPWLAFAVNYQAATSPRFHGPLHVTSRDPEGLANALEFLEYKLPRELIVEMAYPQSLQFGVMFAPIPSLEISGDLRTWHYQLFGRQRTIPVYDPDQPGNEVIDENNLSSDKSDRLSWEVALGVIWRPSFLPGLDLMTGFSYDRSPVPDQTFSMDNPALSSFNFGVGVRYRFADHWRVTLAYLHYEYISRDITNSQTSPSANGRGKGRALLPTIEIEYLYF
jgi:long-subunit fatty acid transport protein